MVNLSLFNWAIRRPVSTPGLATLRPPAYAMLIKGMLQVEQKECAAQKIRTARSPPKLSSKTLPVRRACTEERVPGPCCSIVARL